MGNGIVAGVLTVALLYAMTTSLMQFLELAKKDFSPTLNLSIDPINNLFGATLSALLVTVLCFYLLTNMYSPIGLEVLFPIEKSKWSKYVFTLFIAASNFFYCGFFGIIAAAFLFIAATTDFVVNFNAQNTETEFDDTFEMGF